MKKDLTQGSELKAMLLFSLPLIAGNLLQQMYNVVDTIIVGQALGNGPLAAVSSAYTLMVFITSISLGFCMGSGAVFSFLFGARKMEDLRTSVANAFAFIGLVTLIINIAAYLLLNLLLQGLNIPGEIMHETKGYLLVIFSGIFFVFIYNFFAAALRSVGNSLAPLAFLAISAITNVVLDIIFVIPFGWGVRGAALATVIAQGLSAVAAFLYFLKKAPDLRPKRQNMKYDAVLLKRIISSSALTSIQQSVMNLGILMVQGRVNSFGVAATAAFGAAVKIDAFAYMPVQDFGNAFSTYVAQNLGAGKTHRIQKGVKLALMVAIVFCVVISLAVFVFARPLMLVFVKPHELETLAIGVNYLRIEGAFYVFIGILFLMYGFYRGVGKPLISVILTVVSLGVRVVLAYVLSSVPAIGLAGIWWAIPIGWLLADGIGAGYYVMHKKTILQGGSTN